MPSMSRMPRIGPVVASPPFATSRRSSTGTSTNSNLASISRACQVDTEVDNPNMDWFRRDCMDSSVRKAALAIAIGLALLARGARAQEPARNGSEFGPDPVLSPEPHGQAGRLKAFFQGYNCCCASHHTDLGCTSGEAHCKFIFGSCRTFWMEPCPLGVSPYKLVPPQSMRPPSRWSLLSQGRCATCGQ